MATRDGFVVVLTTTRNEVPNNPRYRGIDRTPPFSLEAFEHGWDDPLLFGDSADETGLIRRLNLANEVRHRYAEIEPAESLEIVFVREAADGPIPVAQPADRPFLGFDVAGETGPFYSIVGDFDPDERVAGFRNCLNEHGLFDRWKDAAAYLAAYRAHQLPDHDMPFTIWEVYAVNGLDQGGIDGES